MATTLGCLPLLLPPLVPPPRSHTRGPGSAPRFSPGPRAPFPAGALDKGAGAQARAAPRHHPEGGEQAKGAMRAVSTGAEQTVAIRINPHPSCWTGLLCTPPPSPYGTAVRNAGASLQFPAPAETLRSKNPKQRLFWCSLPFQGERGWWEQFSVPCDESPRGHMGA